eukprot:CAMPEP_0118888378 /NCGR_PEP_ID=MMETSP1163-20130328/25689_1 /TAXON_ID=124430 /ORGANISM="Phaeomonas parva, Strain CCMP2877" /LENGTH=119 /DNA_ID=CAMNT_0006826941 /DNA_START=457 /DNA_END=818 /DNA_ORIENTATION=+
MLAVAPVALTTPYYALLCGLKVAEIGVHRLLERIAGPRRRSRDIYGTAAGASPRARWSSDEVAHGCEAAGCRPTPELLRVESFLLASSEDLPTLPGLNLAWARHGADLIEEDESVELTE